MTNWSIDDSEQRISSPKTNDVLCQRGKAAFAHEGNLYFRAIIDARVPFYQAAGDRVKKSLIVADIVQHILNRGGRFLKRNASKDHWTVATPRDAKDKVSYALRRSAIGDNRRKFHKGDYSSDEEGSVRNSLDASYDSLLGSTRIESNVSLIQVAMPTSNDSAVERCDLDKVNHTISVCKAESLLQSAIESPICCDSREKAEPCATKNEEMLCHVDMSSLNIPGGAGSDDDDDDDELPFEELFDECNFEKSFGRLIDNYNEMSLQKLINGED
mmetsp:Transcript_14881/g.21947  ORF Transcript_14881/g.21947 Transcript_14881/m.21947 type:complete len:272 (-) Transcript_14881:57-872(-)|eukprot:CAMPEP_0194209984 /NCGR_PEP_ID=MMETSP0156-20130528/7929_1 /TAXON_ID=33649 /ORGANISM="Thalassionema nitzschioides, Strain L26-B" /LENGTH=271 /DNA_ID=CAMNT_0038937257 /DNA_START=52 /DNA_END=867 /DNA_ORIENTATION=+